MARDFVAAEVETPVAAATGPTPAQRWITAGIVTATLAALMLKPSASLNIFHIGFVIAFALSASLKLVLALASRPARLPAEVPHDLPAYTVLIPLYRESGVVDQLMAAVERFEYPRDRLQVILILEEDDEATIAALGVRRLPRSVEILVRPPGGPKTKPNALNAALPLAMGELLVVYDAEDIPHPQQLIEAAARFYAEPDLACLQAPLRISNARSSFLSRQFGLEYAAQFEALIPGIVRFGFAFPLGGTSNHLRLSVLRRLGGWDPYNVTEDADLGLRLGQQGYRIGLTALPTWEDAPLDLKTWLPQRSRWVKGYMQTWGVCMRQPWRGGLRNLTALQGTLGISILGAALHGPLVLVLGWVVIGDLIVDWAPASRVVDLSIMVGGWAATALATSIGARRAGHGMDVMDALACLAYWPMQSLAFAIAARQLVTSPHYWSKTHHVPNAPHPTRGLDGPAPWSVSPAT
jgi:cellulose synthase/poly-beta-1,6-N-acetylglucosamine synthase-like glycosyltransferase